jgi:hypothetical protein
MRFKITFLLMFISIFISCEVDNNINPICDKVIIVCNTENPLQDLPFLKEAKDNLDKIDCAGKSSITQYTYNSETVFKVIICNQIADGQTFVYNCAGETVCVFGGIAGVNTCTDFEKTATDKIILYGN